MEIGQIDGISRRNREIGEIDGIHGGGREKLQERIGRKRVRTNQDLFASIATVVTVAEILKNNGLTVEKKIRTSTVEINDESRGCLFQKAKIEIELGKSDKFDELMAASEEDTEAEDGEEQA
ncbi:hypothetical protein BRADI_2g04537v3 [Brachypodium distachyon]|uniref:DNA/RNA-binding protein Alba-like domain-containing protein n=1 Tax=Brachypodium distachyon TaxID=15368 RepID=I1HCH1_BRADI|nr:hypothetical protein BRADI_2g04537v3 [Brachypodium distachyon]